MPSENWKKIKEIFHAAVELEPVERGAFLDGLNIADAAMRAQIEELLRADDVDAVEETPVVNLAQILQAETAENFIGKQIRNYRIMKEIGRGGMGVVFEAVRTGDDFSQKVALKLLKRGLETNQMLRRFRQERKILASLEHPNIARLLDGGMIADNTPFFALEFVEGVPIDEYCRTKNLSVNERLQLFKQVCAAVSFAHSRLVIHRDLKPSNVLVTNDGTVKLLDFGIAKIISDENSERDGTVTQLGMMTPAYASPEQMGSGAVTTASDVYSLGLILYEMLANRPAYEFPSQRADEMARVICEVEPVRPSSLVINSSPKTNSTNATGQRTNNKGQKTKSLKGDLDNIVLKALRKEPARRYATVQQLSEDIERHLKGLPILARPDTFSYRLEKFVVRNRFAVAGGLLLALTIFAGVAATVWQAVRAERQKALAEKRFNQVRQLANNVVFKYNDAITNLPGSTEVKNMLVKDATDYLDALSEDASDDSTLTFELAQAYLKLADVQGKTYSANVGETHKAAENYQKAVTLFELLAQAPDAAKRDEIVANLIAAYQSFGMLKQRIFDYDGAIELQQKALKIVEEKVRQNPSAANRMLLVRALIRVGDALADVGEFQDFDAYYRKALPIITELRTQEPENDAIQNAFGIVNDRIGRKTMLRADDLDRSFADGAEARKLYQIACSHLSSALEAFRMAARLKPEQARYRLNLPEGLGNLALCLKNDETQSERAVELAREALALTEKQIKEDVANREARFNLTEKLTLLATVLTATENFTETESLYLKALAENEALIKEDPANIELYLVRLRYSVELGDSLKKQNKFDAALKAYFSGEERTKAIFDEKNPSFGYYAAGLIADRAGDVYTAQKKNREAVFSYRRSLENWNQPEARRSELNRAPEQIDAVREKLRECERRLQGV